MHRIIFGTFVVMLLSSALAAQQQVLRQPLSGPDPSSVTVGGAGRVHPLRVTEIMQNTVYMPQEGVPAAQMAQGVVTGPADDWAEIGQVQEIVVSPEGMVVELVVDAGDFLEGAVTNIGISIALISFVSVVNSSEDTFLIIYTGTRERLETASEWTWNGSQPSAARSE